LPIQSTLSLSPKQRSYTMSTTATESPGHNASSGQVDMKLEIDIIPVSDVDRAKQFYERLGWRFDGDEAPLDGLRIVQFTPPGLRGVDHVRRGTHAGCTWFGRGRAGRLRHRDGP
jgi:hypothetical protein